MTTATYQPATGLGQEQWAQGMAGQYAHQPWGGQFGGISPQQFGGIAPLFGGQPGGIASQQFLGQSPQQFLGQSPQQPSQQFIPAIALLPHLINQQVQVLQLLTQLYAQVTQQAYQSGFSGFGTPQSGWQGQRPYQMSY